MIPNIGHTFNALNPICDHISMLHSNQRSRNADHERHIVCPDSGAIDHLGSLDLAMIGGHGFDAFDPKAVWRGFDGFDDAVFHDLETFLSS